MADGTPKLGGVCTLKVSDDADQASPTWTEIKDIATFTADLAVENNVEELACGVDEQAGTTYKFSGVIESIDIDAQNNGEYAGMEAATDLVSNGIQTTAKEGSLIVYQYVRIISRYFKQVPFSENIKYVIEWETEKRPTLSDLITFTT